MSGITVSVTFAENTSGAIYIKEHFSTCKAAFNDSTSAELHIPFPNRDDANPRCPGTEIVMKFEVTFEMNTFRPQPNGPSSSSFKGMK